MLADVESKLVRHAGLVLLIAALVAQGILSAGHVQVLRAPDVRDQAGMWLSANGAQGDAVGMPGRPWFATPPVSKSRFSIEIVPLDVSSIKAAGLQWFILTDYDTEPIRRRPEVSSNAKAAVDFLLGDDEVHPGVHEFAAAPKPPLLVSWGRRLLPHDMRYHCPTIWIVGT
jgi:hypothetical protein